MFYVFVCGHWNGGMSAVVLRWYLRSLFRNVCCCWGFTKGWEFTAPLSCSWITAQFTSQPFSNAFSIFCESKNVQRQHKSDYESITVSQGSSYTGSPDLGFACISVLLVWYDMVWYGIKCWDGTLFT